MSRNQILAPPWLRFNVMSVYIQYLENVRSMPFVNGSMLFYNIIMLDQFGFHKKHCTTHQLLQALEYVHDWFYNEEQTEVFLLDVARPFWLCLALRPHLQINASAHGRRLQPLHSILSRAHIFSCSLWPQYLLTTRYFRRRSPRRPKDLNSELLFSISTLMPFLDLHHYVGTLCRRRCYLIYRKVTLIFKWPERLEIHEIWFEELADKK